VDSSSCLRRSPTAAFQSLAGEAVLIHMQTGAYYSLNEVGTVFWEMLDGEASVADCALRIAQEYSAPLAVIQADLLELAQDLLREGLAERPR